MKRGYIGIRVSSTHAWVIVGNANDPEDLVVIGPGPTIPITKDNPTQEFLDVLEEVSERRAGDEIAPELQRAFA